MKLTVLKKNLTFSEALQAIKEGKWVKVPEWKGYWFLQGGLIRVRTEDGNLLETPWLKENVLREDWQIVQEDVDEMIKAFKNQPLQYFNGFETREVDTRRHIPVEDNSNAFTAWLQMTGIDFKPSGHQTIIIGEVDMFRLGEEWSYYKQNNKPPTQTNN